MALARLARWSYRRRWMVLALWIVALIGINVVGKAIEIGRASCRERV